MNEVHRTAAVMFRKLDVVGLIFATGVALAATGEPQTFGVRVADRGPSAPLARQAPASASRDSGSTPLGLEVVWRRPLGPGHSRIAVADTRVLTLFSDGTFDNLIAMDTRSGTELWRYRIAETYRGHDGSRDGPHSSPIVEDGVVYSLGPHGQLFAVRLADGVEIWSRDIVAELGAAVPFWGFASTPVVEGDVLIVPTGGGTARSMSGFDRKTGELLWAAGDDLVGYQSPAVIPLVDTTQVIAVTNHHIMGLAPQTGEVLWTHEHSETGLDGSSEPVAVGGDDFLVTSSFTEHVSDTTLFRAVPTPGGPTIEPVWSTNALTFSYTIPVVHEEHLFGFQRGFLSCVDLSNGRSVWKSRSPGGNNLILVDGRLVILATDGSVVVASATPDGYEELARVEALERGAFSAPAHGDGLVFVRNHAEIAAVRMGVGKLTEAVDRPDWETARVRTSAFGVFVTAVEGAPLEDRPRLVDAFMARQRQFPIIEGDDMVHVVYRGTARDVVVQGLMTGWGESHPLTRLLGTDLFYRSYTLDGDGRWQYAFEVDMARWTPDPLNPRRAPGNEEDSELAMPGWTAPDHLREPVGSRGTVEEFAFHSELLDNERDVRVYLPPGYSRSSVRYPVMLVVDGLPVLRFGEMDRSLDNLIGTTVRPMMVAFVGPSKSPDVSYREAGGPEVYREHGGELTAVLARALAEELVPRLDASYRTIRHPDARAVMGVRAAGLVALSAAVHHPSVFGNVAVQSMWLGPTPLQSSRVRPRSEYDALVATLEDEPHVPIALYIDWARDDLRSRGEDIDLRRDLTALVDVLRERGYRVAGGEYPGAPGWGSWRARTDEILETLFPSE